MNRWDQEIYDRILADKAARDAEIAEMQDVFNRCAWCAEARVSPGQRFCLTHEVIGTKAVA